MTDREKAVIQAYTGIRMLSENKMKVFYEYLDDLFGRHVGLYEIQTLSGKISVLARDDFDSLRRDETARWIDGKVYAETIERKCPGCGQTVVARKADQMNFCPRCGLSLR